VQPCVSGDLLPVVPAGDRQQPAAPAGVLCTSHCGSDQEATGSLPLCSEIGTDRRDFHGDSYDRQPVIQATHKLTFSG